MYAKNVSFWVGVFARDGEKNLIIKIAKNNYNDNNLCHSLVFPEFQLKRSRK